jgi:phage-related protein
MGLPARPSPRPLEWIASSRADLRKFPEDVRKEMGHSLHLAQLGERPNHVKPLNGSS